MRVSSFDEMVKLMTEWGIWIRDTSVIKKLDYPCSDNLQKFRGYGGGGFPRISDDDALEITREMQALYAKDKQLCKVLDCFYHFDFTLTQIAEKFMLVNRQSAKREVDRGVGWIWGSVSKSENSSKKTIV